MYVQQCMCALFLYLKAVDSLWHVYSCDVHELSVLGILVVSQKCQHRDDSIGVDQHLQLIAALQSIVLFKTSLFSGHSYIV